MPSKPFSLNENKLCIVKSQVDFDSKAMWNTVSETDKTVCFEIAPRKPFGKQLMGVATLLFLVINFILTFVIYGASQDITLMFCTIFLGIAFLCGIIFSVPIFGLIAYVAELIIFFGSAVWGIPCLSMLILDFLGIPQTWWAFLVFYVIGGIMATLSLYRMIRTHQWSVF